MTDPLILIPGLLCDAALFQHQAHHLAMLAPVQIETLTQQDSVAAMAMAVLAQAPPRFALAGLSMGGYVALEVMRQAPQRVARLALLDTQARADDDDQRRRRRGLIALAQQGAFRGVTPRLLPYLLSPGRLQDADLIEVISAMAARIGRDAFVRQQTAILSRPDSRPMLGTIRCPTLVLCGREDQLTPLALSEEMAGAIPGADLAVVEACGHVSTLEQPVAVTALLRLWLTRGA